MPSDTPFSELAQVNPPRPALDLRDLDPVSFIPMGNVSESGRWTEQQSRPLGEVRSGYTYCAEGDVLFAKITPCTENGKGCHAIGLTNGVGFASTEFHVLRAKEGVDPGYIYQWSVNLSLRLKAAAHMTGSAGQQRVPVAFFSTFAVPKLPLPEQAKIAEVLSTVDRAIEQTEALIAKQQRIKTGLMQDLLTGGIDEHGDLRSEQTHEFKDSPIGRIPVEWDVKALHEIVDESITYGIVQAGPHVDGGVPYIRTGDMRGDEINVEKLLRTAPQVAQSYKRSAVWVGDIVFALRATVGKALPVTVELDGANLTQGTAKISPKKSIDSDFLLWAMRTSQVQNAIRLEQKGTTFMEITLGDLRTIRLGLPKKKHEQSLIAEKLNRHDRLRRVHAKQRDKLVSLKRGLMRDLLTGNRRVTALLEQREGVAT